MNNRMILKLLVSFAIATLVIFISLDDITAKRHHRRHENGKTKGKKPAGHGHHRKRKSSASAKRKSVSSPNYPTQLSSKGRMLGSSSLTPLSPITMNGETVKVHKLTIQYNYSLRDGQIMFTPFDTTLIPTGMKGKFAILGQTAFRNLHQGTRTPVSLDEVYVHHVLIWGTGFGMQGAETLNHIPQVPEGYGFIHETPAFGLNAHMISGKNLAPIDGSVEVARKQCNECYYAPGKGDLCTPKTNGTFACCGDGAYMKDGQPSACDRGDSHCNCKSTTNGGKPTPYMIEMDFIVTQEVEKVKPLHTWFLWAPGCFKGVAPGLEPNISVPMVSQGCMLDAQGSYFHQVLENDKKPVVRTSGAWIAQFTGFVRTAFGHFHTGGINASLSVNGRRICTSTGHYGTKASTKPTPDNARNEFGHLIAIDDCVNATSFPRGLPVKVGDVFSIESNYYVGRKDKRLPRGGGGSHLNVMSLFALFIDNTGSADGEYPSNNTKGELSMFFQG